MRKLGIATILALVMTLAACAPPSEVTKLPVQAAANADFKLLYQEEPNAWSFYQVFRHKSGECLVFMGGYQKGGPATVNERVCRFYEQGR